MFSLGSTWECYVRSMTYKNLYVCLMESYLSQHFLSVNEAILWMGILYGVRKRGSISMSVGRGCWGNIDVEVGSE